MLLPCCLPSPPCPVLSVQFLQHTVFCVQHWCQVGLCLGELRHHSCQVTPCNHPPLCCCWAAHQPFGHSCNHRAASRLQHSPLLLQGLWLEETQTKVSGDVGNAGSDLQKQSAHSLEGGEGTGGPDPVLGSTWPVTISKERAKNNQKYPRV